jgi:hypothetical protein
MAAMTVTAVGITAIAVRNSSVVGEDMVSGRPLRVRGRKV